MTSIFDQEAERIGAMLPSGARVGVLGSTAAHHPETLAFCQDLGRSLAEVPGLVLLTGGVRGVGETVGRAFHRVFEVFDQPSPVFHVLPEGPYLWDYGQTLYTGTTMEHRREVLGRLSSCYVVVEGGPGTQHEAQVAIHHGALVIPVGRYGGQAASLWRAGPGSSIMGQARWESLGSETVPRAATVDAVLGSVAAWIALRRPTTAAHVEPPR